MSHQTKSSKMLYLAAVAAVASTLLVGSASTQAGDEAVWVGTPPASGNTNIQMINGGPWDTDGDGIGDATNVPSGPDLRVVVDDAFPGFLTLKTGPGSVTVGHIVVRNQWPNAGGNQATGITGSNGGSLTLQTSDGSPSIVEIKCGPFPGWGTTWPTPVTLKNDVEVFYSGGSPHRAVISEAISGVGGVTLKGSSAGGTYNAEIYLRAVQTFHGDLVLNGGSRAQILFGDYFGVWRDKTFYIRSTGDNNKITGTGSLQCNGRFIIDLSAAADDGSWTLVNHASLGTVTYGPTFAVVGWTDNLDGTWSIEANNATYTFDELTGILTAVPNNQPPVAIAQDVTVFADGNCVATWTAEQVNNGSSDPDGDPITISIDVDQLDGTAVALPASVVVTLTVSDGVYTATATATVTVEDKASPILNGVPAFVAVGTGEGSTSCSVTAAEVGLPVVTADDNCDPNVVVTSDAPATFPVGETTVTWTATDASTNIATAVTYVTVSDTTAPAITVNGDRSFYVECGYSFSDPGASAVDNCDAAPSLTDDGASVPATAPVGSMYTITYTATDAAGNVSTAERGVAFVDTVDPVISGATDITLGCDAIGGSLSEADLLDGVTVDDCSAVTLSVTSDLPSSLVAGTYTATITAEDEGGNTATATRTITVAGFDVAGFMAPLNRELVDLGSSVTAPGKGLKATRNCIPLKMAISCGTAVISDADLGSLSAPTIVSITYLGEGNILEDVEVDSTGESNVGNTFRYSDGQWIYNLDSSSLTKGVVYTITIQLPDGVSKYATFVLR